MDEAELNQWDYVSLEERTEPDLLDLEELVEVNGRLHAKVLAKAALLGQEAADTDLVTNEVRSLLDSANSFRRYHTTLLRTTALRHRAALEGLISKLDAARDKVKAGTKN